MGEWLVGDILERSVALYGDRTAVIEGGLQRTYAETAVRIRSLAAGILATGVEPGQHIGILASNSHRYLETYFAAHYAGTPLAPLNMRLSAPELEFIINDGELRALLVGPEFVELLESFRDRLPKLEHVILLADSAPDGMHAYEELVAGNAPLAAAARDWQEDDMLNLCYTGGTTGLPKGVMLSQRNVVSNAQHIQMTFAFEEPDVWLHAAPMFHLADAWACYSITAAGGAHAFIPGFAPDPFLAVVQDARVTSTILVPTMINFVVNHPNVRDYDLSSLRALLFGASPMPTDRILAAKEIFGPILAQAYGMTETAPLLTAQRLEWLDYDTPEGIERLASCGRQVQGVAGSRGRRRRLARPARRHRRGRRARPQRDARLLEPSRGDRRRPARWLDAYRRCRPHRRPGLHLHRRPLEGHDRERRRERVYDRDGGRPLRARRRPRSGRLRDSRRALGRSRPRRRRPARRRQREESTSSSTATRSSPATSAPRASSSTRRRCPSPGPARSSKPSCARPGGRATSGA